MAHPKNLRSLIFFIFLINQLSLRGQADSLLNVNGFKINITYLKKYRVNDVFLKRNHNYPLANFSNDPDSLARFSFDKGLRFGTDFDFFFSKRKVFRNFSITLGSWYQSTLAETIFYATSRKNSNGAQQSNASIRSNSISALMAVNYFHCKVRFTFGLNLSLYHKNKFEFKYRDGQIISGTEPNPENLSFFYSCIEVPILFKNKLLFRAIASFDGGDTVYAGFGLAYRIKSFQPK